MSEFGDWIKAIRESRGMTTRFAARSAGIHEVQWSRIESGGANGRRDTILSMIKAVGADANEGLLKAGYAPLSEQLDPDFHDDTDDPGEIAIQAFYTGSPPEVRREILGAVAKIVREHQRSHVTHGKKAE